MFERPQRGNRAVLVVLDTGDGDRAHRHSELSALAVSAGGVRLQLHEDELLDRARDHALAVHDADQLECYK